MAKVIKSDRFNITFNLAFEKVIEACATISRQGEEGTWITQEMKSAYIDLHGLGYAHSVEVWEKDALIGGLYGVAVNNVFCGESMFSKVSNASKAALISLCNDASFLMIDCQFYTRHLESLGAELISRNEYLIFLNKK